MGQIVRAGEASRQRPITYVLGALLGVALLLGLAPPASDAAPPRSSFPGVTGTVVDWSGDGLVRSERYRGATRFDTASLIGREGFDPSAAVLIARGDAFPDSLAGNYLAGQLGAPVLLTHTTFVPDETRAAIADLGARHAFILGGPEAVSEAVADQLRAMGLNVGRIAGLHRYATAAAIATQPGTTVGFLNGRRTAIVASGENFPDALVAGAVAFSAEFPLLLTPSASLHPDTAEALESRAITQVIIAGGPVAVSDAVAAQLRARGITVIRVAGDDRVETAVAIERFARDQLGWGTEVLNFAVGANFPDALSLGARAGLIRSPVLLTWGPDTLDSSSAALTPFLEALGCEVELVRVAGGPAAVSVAVEFQIRRLATEDGACGLTLDPSQATNPVATDHSVTATVAGHAVDRLPDAPVRFEVYRSIDGGDNFGAVPVATDTVTTDADGEATLDYDGPATAAVDRIVACVDGNDDGCATVAAGNVVTDADDVADTATKTWQFSGPDTLVLEPGVDTNTVGEDHTVTATLTDSFGNPVSGATVRFEITGDGDPTPAADTDTTDTNGEATFTFTNEEPGQNTITACTDDDGAEPDTCAAATGPSDTATKTWAAGDPQMLVLDPETATNTVGEDHTVTATVTDSFGNPVPGAGVRFELTGDGTPDPDSGTGTTDANGAATFTFTNPESGTNTITACTNDAGSLPTSCNGATGPSDDATKEWEPIAQTLTLTPEADSNEVGATHTVTATVTDPDNDPVEGAVVRFEVTGDGTPDPDSGTAITNADGEATFTFTNESTGDNTITACTDEDATAPSSCEDATGPSDTATKTWTAGAPAMLTLTPESATNSLNADHSVTATVTDSSGNPVPGAMVRFEVWRGNDLTPTADPAEATSQTDANGQATFTYTSGAEGSDVVFACTTSDGTAPDSCSTDGETVAPGLVGDTADKHWTEPDTLALDPDSDTNTVGEDHTVTATVTGDGRRLAGARVRFEVTGTVTLTEVRTTDANGEASFTYTSQQPGDDTITACTNDDGSEPASCGAATGPSDTATKTWEPGAPSMLVLDPETTTNTIREDHTVTATVTDSFDNPVPGATVRFEVTGDGTPTPSSGSDTTDANGEATFTFTNPESGTNTITACTNDAGSLPTSCGEASGPSDTTGKVWEPVAQSLTLTPEADTNEVGATHTVTATVTDPDNDPVEGAVVRFEVTGDGTPDPDSETAITNADGEATFTFTNESTGDNTITACTDEDATAPSSCEDATGPSDTATKTWTAGPPTMLSLAPETSTNTVGSDHTVTATLTDGFGNPVPGATVRFEVDSDGDPSPVSGTDTTDANGQATFTFSNGVAGGDTITACTNSDGSEPASCATATGPNDSATKTWTTTAAPADITLEPITDDNGVAEDHTVTATVLDADDQPVQGAIVRFEVTGDGSPDPAGGTAVTDADGTATFTFTNDTPGQNTITACTTADGSDPGSCATADPSLTATATKTWEQRAATVTLEPDTDANPVGTEHTVTATVLDGAGQPMDGVHVRFDVFRDGQKISIPDDGRGVTDVNGDAALTYPGPSEPAADVIWACVFDGATPGPPRPSHCTVDDAGQQAREVVIADTADKAWEVPAPQSLTVTPTSDTNMIGSSHTVTATVLDQFGEPFEGANVLFEVTSDGSPDPESGTDTTDANGDATFTFTNLVPGQDTITACTNSDGTLPASCATATGPSGTATKTWQIPPP